MNPSATQAPPLRTNMIPPGEHRTPEQLAQHFLVEIDLASRLKASAREQRWSLYPKLYDELFRLVPTHPQLTVKLAPEDKEAIIAGRMRLLERYLAGAKVFLEIGAGTCGLSMAVARKVQQVYAVEVSAEVTAGLDLPSNLKLILTNNAGIDLPSESVDVAYSDQVIEHVHPDDALDQMREIYRVLRPGGIYMCITPSRLCGPHDISRYFLPEARGFHLKEYVASELAEVFQAAGFREVWLEKNVGGRFRSVPLAVQQAAETLCRVTGIAHTGIGEKLVNLVMTGRK